MRKLDERGWILIVFVILISIVLIILSYTYLLRDYEEIFGADKFAEFDVIQQESETINNQTFYKVDFKLTALKNMYKVEIATKNSSGITKISLNEGGIPPTRTIQVGTAIYPDMTVQLGNNISYGYVVMQVSFNDIDNDEKKINKDVTIISESAKSTGGFEFVLVMAGISLVAYFIRKREKL
jgi:hypothetical protein